MIFKTRPGIKKQFDTLHNFGYKNLIVSGCSFTYNNHEACAVSWPYYLRDLGGFDQVLDTSMPGGGNYHISNSLIWALDSEAPDPKDSLVVVMWSGNDRDDYITPTSNIHASSFGFKYNNEVGSAITGGAHKDAGGNTKILAKDFFAVKTQQSRAVENYLYMLNTWNYLQNNNYSFLFLNFLDPSEPSRTLHFDMRKFLPVTAQDRLDQMIAPIIDPHSFSLSNNLLDDDDFHPTPDGQLAWTRNILVPKLQNLLG